MHSPTQQLSEVNRVLLDTERTTQFPLRLHQPAYWNTANPATEQTLLARWESLRLPDLVREARQGAETFWLLDGPPFANGEAHLGHLLNKTLKDLNARFQSVMGKQVVWRAGWDCHGLPLELAVEKRRGTAAKQHPVQFVAACREEAATWQRTQSLGMRRLGVMADFDQPWLTMDPQREAANLGLLKELWEAGLLVERHSPVHWCPLCQSALAASELETAEKERTEAWFLAPLTRESAKRLQAKLGDVPDELFLMSWTTTPWTLWANAAFAHPVQGASTLVTLASGKTALMAVEARDNFLQSHAELLSDPGHRFDGVLRFEQLPDLRLRALAPLSAQLSPLLPANFASAGDGSGFVHVAPAFGAEDFELHESYGEQVVRMECHVAANGRLQAEENAPPLPARLHGLTLDEASVASCDLLDARGLLVAQELKTVEVHTCWRHKKPTFYRASRQWALDLHAPFAGCEEGLAVRAKTALDACRFLPDERAKVPLATMLSTRRYWTLSRDRLWGLPLPFFRHVDTGALHPDSARLWDELVARVKVHGVEAWHDMPTPESYRKTTQTVDVWFDSGAAWHSASEQGLHQPDLGVEGRDQTRGWFLSSFLLHAFKSREPAFKSLMTHSFLLGEDGLKLSKSAGGAGGSNAMAPATLFSRHGADAFRLWVSAQTVGDEARAADSALHKAGQELKDWRSFLRFMLANMQQAPNQDRPSLRPFDRLSLHKACTAREEWRRHMQAGKFNLAMQALAAYRLWASSEWFELNKRLLYCARDEDPGLRSMQWSLQQVFVLFCRMLAPVMPFAAEEAYLAWSQHPYDSVFVGVVAEWDMPNDEGTVPVQQALAWRKSLLPLVEKVRATMDKGEPVALAFGGTLPFGFDEDGLREWFPHVYTLKDGVATQFSSGMVGADSNVYAGKVLTAYRPHRCARCRGYFERDMGEKRVCLKCEEEMG